MSTITGEILIGRGHPNDDGIMAFSILGRLQLIEGGRATWVIDTTQEKWLRDYRFTVAPRPGQIAMCGLILSWLVIAATEPGRDPMLTRFCDAHAEVRGDLTKMDKKAFRLFWDHLRTWGRGRPQKVIATSFEYGTLSHQCGVFEEQSLDFEILSTKRSRLYSQWLNAPVEIGEGSPMSTPGMAV
ncbi:MAG: hypothetical protein ABJO09_05885 [Hyphomicrobiales bacterium]|uniref:hypothetical protein n=1 Tax=Nisaea sp. TaxID=2024842 RepID=UPI003296F35D